MELALSLGEAPKGFNLVDKLTKMPNNNDSAAAFCIPLASSFTAKKSDRERGSSDPPVPLDLLPLNPVHPPRTPQSHLPIPWLSHALRGEGVSSAEGRGVRGLDVNRLPGDAEDGGDDGDAAALSSSSFQMDFGVRNSDGGFRQEGDAGDRGSDDDDNGCTRKKLRLSKEQSAFLEESFKEHTTLNPNQKLALAKQLSLRPRQVEVWFQNRRARTKLKQTEVDCEYLKRCCKTLTEENRRLQKELQELRALKTCQPFYMQLPATTLTMCPSCEKVATKSSSVNPRAQGHTPS